MFSRPDLFFESMGTCDVTKWPGSCFHNEGSCWTCRICGLVASNKIGNSLRKSVRKFHTVSRCAKDLRYSSDAAKAKAVENVEGVGIIYLEHFMELSPTGLVLVARQVCQLYPRVSAPFLLRI